MAHISQREAHRNRKRLRLLERHLERQNNYWSSEFPGGVHIGSLLSQEEKRKVMLARKLGHAVVCTANDHEIHFFAIKLEDV